MRILVITDLFPPDVVGGYEIRCEEAIEWLNRHGYEIEVLTTKSSLNIDRYCYKVHRILEKYPGGATPREWGIHKRFLFAVKDNFLFKRAISKFNPDLLYLWHCQGISRSLIPQLFNSSVVTVVDVSDKWLYKVSKEMGPVYGVLSHKSSNYIKKWVQLILLKLLPILSFGLLSSIYRLKLNNVKGYFTSQWNYDFHLKNIKEIKKFKVINTGINLKMFPYRKKQMFSNKINLLFVGQVSEQKGIFLLFKQIENISKKNKLLIKLDIVGDFTNINIEKIIKSKIIKLNMSIKVNLIRRIPRDEIFNYYHKSHFTIFTSIWEEPFSRVPLESMACGTPCISTDNTGSNELFKNNAPLILLDRNNKKSIFSTINYYRNNPREYIELSSKGRKYIETKYTFDNFMKKVEPIFYENE